MASFVENLWNSVFTPGTTPTLLIATNVSFAALQVILGLLLAATKSIHFVVLSTICAGLWWAINWFAVELQKAEKAEEEASRIRKRRSGMMAEKRDRSTNYSGDDSTETEIEFDGIKGPMVRGGPQKAIGVMESAAAAREDTPVVRTRGGPGKPQAVMDSAGMGDEEFAPIQTRGGPAKIQGVMDSAAAAQAERDAASGVSSGLHIRGGPDKIAAVLGLDRDEGHTSAGADPKRKSLGEGGESGSVSTDSEWEKVSDR